MFNAVALDAWRKQYALTLHRRRCGFSFLTKVPGGRRYVSDQNDVWLSFCYLLTFWQEIPDLFVVRHSLENDFTHVLLVCHFLEGNFDHTLIVCRSLESDFSR